MSRLLAYLLGEPHEQTLWRECCEDSMTAVGK